MSVLSEKIVLAVDPGSAKCGLALVKRLDESHLELLWRKVTPVEGLDASVDEASSIASFSMVIVGSGSSSEHIVRCLRDHMPSIGILVVDERDTSLQARERYWEHNPRKGWRKLIPATMQTPPEPIDDFAALILAERVLQT